MVRAAVLSLLVLLSLAALLPLTSSLAVENERPAATRRNKRLRRHSRAWWRRYRAHLRRKRAALEREKALAAWREQRGDAPGRDGGSTEAAISPNSYSATGGVFNDPLGLFSLTMPSGWSNRPVTAGGETRFRIYAPDGRAVGQATLAPVSVSASGRGALSARARSRMLGGVLFADLRRTVIDKMVASNGWVLNDLERQIGGRRVFVVLAQTAASPDASTPQQSWTFYFIEMDGRVYSLATNVSLEYSDRIAAESEQVMASFRAGRASTPTETSRY